MEESLRIQATYFYEWPFHPFSRVVRMEVWNLSVHIVGIELPKSELAIAV